MPKKPTAQSIFNRMYTRTVKQGEPSTDGAGCYLRKNGTQLKCTFGHLLPDAIYEPRLEGAAYQTLEQLAVGNQLQKNFAKNVAPFKDLIVECQSAHDLAALSEGYTESTFLKRFKSKMAEIAKRRGLKIPKVK